MSYSDESIGFSEGSDASASWISCAISVSSEESNKSDTDLPGPLTRKVRSRPSSSLGTEGVSSTSKGPERGRKRSGAVKEGRVPTANLSWEFYDKDDPYEVEWIPDFNQQPGPLIDTTGFTEEELFSIFFPLAAFELMVEQTNKYASTHLHKNKFYEKRWKDVTVEEMKAFVGLQVAMGLYPRPALLDHWASFWLDETKFGLVMSRHRYQMIQTCLHFLDNAAWIPRGQDGFDPLAKIQPLLDITGPTYPLAYYPHRQLAVNESVARFKGRIHTRQYIMSDKLTKHGIRIFSLCDAVNRYMLKFMVSSSEERFQVEGDNFACFMVKELVKDYIDKGHVLYTDHFFTYPSLVQWLKGNSTGAVGTVLESRPDFPPYHKGINLALKKGDSPVFSRSGEIVCVTWHDAKRCSLMSTIHTDNTVDKLVRKRGAPGGFRTVEKPVIAEDYNGFMGGVDYFDQVTKNCEYPHRNCKWYHALYHFVKEVAMVNAFALYKAKQSKETFAKDFRNALIDQLVSPHMKNYQRARQARPNPAAPRLSAAESLHFPRKYTDPKHRPRCRVCAPANIRAQTRHYCPSCDVALCIDNCFELYHTKSDYVTARRALAQ
ncbi:piggyBac transposable element-derived protein 4-like [Aplysia californica]|uniref:PiggyBac transposable element-derived protein 4-like n=1 Tax=Aplysia californica TaxID=6500 RepID=A0ABM0JM15_APLCA|nr:piggyBac transposable element-derived protein 4-like [Aplysia californica]